MMPKVISDATMQDARDAYCNPASDESDSALEEEDQEEGSHHHWEHWAKLREWRPHSSSGRLDLIAKLALEADVATEY